ncbi:protein-glutamate methylesterase/protein-glutamine glutaminase [Paenibacillus guangzhouensis]|uniref:protein-glutamate methylesterase/protein-glutamine glutaminase n=1 Tax=Paenibacillus guangzhouensis TaxID=1473112 RepID=UPI00126698CD|nr:chemotaxis response regulator protein-glutamate methylesterase [Paenibacillus guangzhouensis]
MQVFKVLVIDDSAFMRKYISDMVTSDTQFEVVDTAKNGQEAVEKVKSLNPDVITMDIEMPVMNGLEALKVIMEDHPTPAIMLSSFTEKGARETILALELGAFDFIQKPSGTISCDIHVVSEHLHERLRAAITSKMKKRPIQVNVVTESESIEGGSPKVPIPPISAAPAAPVIPVKKEFIDSVRKPMIQERQELQYRTPLSPKKLEPIKPEAPKWDRKLHTVETIRETAATLASVPPNEVRESKIKQSKRTTFNQLVAVGSSTGGPRALKELLTGIPEDFPAPIVIVQHMPANFTKSLAQRLNTFCQIRVVEAENGDRLEPGTAYIAPGGWHMTIRREAKGTCVVELDKQELRNGHRPSVDILFESLIPLKDLEKHIVLLTGMGSDGARAMKSLTEHGVKSTFAESEESCVVYGMPRSAIELGCVKHILPIQEIAPKLLQVVK